MDKTVMAGRVPGHIRREANTTMREPEARRKSAQLARRGSDRHRVLPIIDAVKTSLRLGEGGIQRILRHCRTTRSHRCPTDFLSAIAAAASAMFRRSGEYVS